MEPDFSGYATKAGLKCTDGRTITPDAFKHQDKMTVPLVWQHGHNNVTNILGHAILEHREDGVYAHGYFNQTSQGQSAKVLVQHNDIKALSIYANQLVEKSKVVLHGAIKEVSLVLSGANPGAVIDFVAIQHDGGDIETLDDEAVIYTGLELQHSEITEEIDEEELAHADQTLQDLYDSLTADQKNLVHYMVGAALESATSASHADGDDPEGDLTHQEGNEDMSRNVFEQANTTGTVERATLTHDQLTTILDDAKKPGMTLKESFLAHAGDFGINNIELLFPDARNVQNSPEWISRRMEWVSTVLGGTKHSPFSRIKTMSADITLDTARAKGYVKGTLKKNEFFGLISRTTTPKTIYKKQKLDRDDIIDITDLDVVAWLKAEMRVMLDEEIARAILIGDGREPDDPDKIDENFIRPIATDDNFYTHQVSVGAASVTGDALVDVMILNRQYYRGAGNPTMFTTESVLASMLIAKDSQQRRLYGSVQELATALRVSSIVTVPVMEGAQTDQGDILFILVNLSDYTIGADSGGAIAMFDDFDIDYNQQKYLIETRISGALTDYKKAMVFTRTPATNATLVTPATPTFVSGTGVVTIPATAGVDYKNGTTGAILTSGAQTALTSGQTLVVDADPQAGYRFPHNFDEDWSFTRP